MPFPVSRIFIERAELELGAALPSQLVERLVRLNGGEVDADRDTWTLCPVFDDSDRKRMARTASHILRETKVAKEWPDFPENAIAIGHNGSGDMLILIRQGNRFGDQVFRWDHETGKMRAIKVAFGSIASA